MLERNAKSVHPTCSKVMLIVTVARVMLVMCPTNLVIVFHGPTATNHSTSMADVIVDVDHLIQTVSMQLHCLAQWHVLVMARGAMLWVSAHLAPEELISLLEPLRNPCKRIAPNALLVQLILMRTLSHIAINALLEPMLLKGHRPNALPAHQAQLMMTVIHQHHARTAVEVTTWV